MKHEFCRQIFENSSNMKFYQNPSSRRRVVCGRTDGHDEAFRNFANVHKNKEYGELVREFHLKPVYMFMSSEKSVYILCTCF